MGEKTRGEQMMIGKPHGDQVLSLETSGIQMLVEKPKGDEVLTKESREYHRRKQKQRRRGKAGGKGRAVHRRKPKELEDEGRQGKQLSFVKARSPRQKKSNFVRKKRNKARVLTVDRYRYEHKDGSITWGFKNDDGGFKVIFLFLFFFYGYILFRKRRLGWTALPMVNMATLIVMGRRGNTLTAVGSGVIQRQER